MTNSFHSNTEYKQKLEALHELHQNHILITLEQWKNRPDKAIEYNRLEESLAKLDICRLKEQLSLLQNKKALESTLTFPISPLERYEEETAESDLSFGHKLLEQGKVGAVVLAGGQGTRLGVELPKGCFPISVIEKKSLFQLLAEKTRAASKQSATQLPLAIMTSEENHKATTLFFQEHERFGLSTDQLHFFTQSSLPLLSEEGKLIIAKDGSLLYGADGNGSFFTHFVQSGLYEKWHKAAIEIVTVIIIDNPLANPFDAALLSVHAKAQNDVTIKGVWRQDPLESVGVIVKDANQATRVVEYSEISKEERLAYGKEGKLLHPIANISYFCFSLSFIKEVATHVISQNQLSPADHIAPILPLHKAKKRFSKEKLATIESDSSDHFWKFEQFIFDAFQIAKRSSVLVANRNDCFAPLKNGTGEDSPEKVQWALVQKDHKQFEQITGRKLTDKPIFELDMEFHYPTEELKEKWKNKNLPREKYIKA